MKKQASKKVVLYSEEIRGQRKRISFRDYSKDKETFELVVDWIFLPLRFPRYGILLTDGSEEYRISLNIDAERAENILDVFNFKVGKDRVGKILLLCKRDKEISVEEGKEEVIYRWVSGKGWRLVTEVSEEKDDIPF